MCEFLRENPIIWGIKKSDYRRVDKKAKLWEEQDYVLGKPVEHLQGWLNHFGISTLGCTKEKAVTVRGN